MILIVTGEFDPHADHVEALLRDRGTEVVRFNPGDFPAASEVTVAIDPDCEPRFVIRQDGAAREIDLGAVRSVWFRRPDYVRAAADQGGEEMRSEIERHSHSLLMDALDSLECLAVPGWRHTVHRTQLKVLQLKLAREIGFEVPATRYTNSPDALLELYREHDGQIVTKPLIQSELPPSPAFPGAMYMRYTEPVRPRDLAAAHSLRSCPMIVQAYVPKRLELRVTVVGEQLFAAEIHSQATNRTRHDWRRYDSYHTVHRPHRLPVDVADQCLALVRRLGLCYGAIDLILTPDGRYVFLEINPSGQYLWIEEKTGLPISDALCALLIGGRAARNVPTAGADASLAFSGRGAW